ncbi:hypothetical protein E0I26_05225 [Flavobacterium rhamnosiphilum]|uniref:Uncharacterized protein n=1 Tax=Flavobacterium rhamnosiphilum TaxID=2541724 RepID=A0A4R5F9S8_9FLAO|nr:hypothetical protein [Flavobacterium rhamnosiphilum]TDE45355.1 hypothetical protein E0I26_05225 [Flavobacterium rhamnosiphilum]
MTKFSKLLFSLMSGVFIFGCSSDKDCVKTITIPAYSIHTPTGSSYYPESTREVSCDYVITPISESKTLTNFSYEVLSFNFTPDTGKNTSRLQFEIKLNNLSDFSVNGFPVLTVDADGLESSGGYSNGAISTCSKIEAKSSCIFSYDKESSLEIGKIKSLTLVAVKYYLAK